MSDEVYRSEYYLAAGDATPQQLMPIGLVFDRCIEISTDHANLLGVGYDDLHQHGQSWVLSRVAIEMDRYPQVNEVYSLETWVRSLNRAFSDRYCRILDAEGGEIGRCVATWVAIDIERRTMADISRFDGLKDSIVSQQECQIRPCGRLRPAGADAEVEQRSHKFQYSDLDSNRHVNTVRYVELLMDCWPLDFHDRHRVSRIEVAFMKECRYGETAAIALRGTSERSEVEFKVGNESRVHFAVEFSDAPESGLI